ncbi:hypothetical protein ALDI51_39920 [Alicycliphilus denitrificans]|nr:hypothetical protein ALDI51_39920 [Alicycliphilus denitrificans]
MRFIEGFSGQGQEAARGAAPWTDNKVGMERGGSSHAASDRHLLFMAYAVRALRKTRESS